MQTTNSILHYPAAAILIIIIISSAVYFNSLNAPFIFDDISKIVENPDLKSLSNLKTKLIYPYEKKAQHSFGRNDPSRPITYLSFTLNYYFNKLNTFGYHLFNLLIHISVASAVFFLTRQIISFTYRKHSFWFPYLTSLFFAVHPINTEVVTYIYHRSESLAALFYLLALLCFIKSLNKKIFYIISLLCFILAFFSKQTAATLPLIIIIFDYIFLSDFNFKKVLQRKYYHLPFWLLLAVFVIFRKVYLGKIGDAETNAYINWNNYSYLLIQPYVVLKYLKALIIPAGLCIDHVLNPPHKLLDGKILLPFFLIILMISASFYNACRQKTNAAKIILFSVGWFFIVLSPTSSFFPIADPMAERRLYLSGFGFALLSGWLYFQLLSTGTSPRLKLSLFMLPLLHLTLLGTTTIQRNQLYNRPVLMWQDVIKKYPANSRAHTNLGHLYQIKKDYSRAIKEYQKAIEIEPSSYKDYNNLGVIYHEQKKYAQARENYAKAIEINPDFLDVYNNLGVLYDENKEYEKAKKEFQKVLEINENYAIAHNNLGNVYTELKKYDQAVKEYTRTLQLNPDYNIARKNLATAYFFQKEYAKSLRQFKSALKFAPQDEGIKAKIEIIKKLLVDSGK